MARLKVLIATLIAQCALLSASPAFADYMVPEAAEMWTVIVSQWTIAEKTAADGKARNTSNSAKSYNVYFDKDGKKYVWPIDLFLMAHYSDSDSICGGTHEIEMTKTIEDIRKKQGKHKLQIRLTSTTAGGELNVAGVHLYDEEAAWNTAIQQGSHILNLSAEKVRQLGKAKYEAALLAVSDEGFKKIGDRKVK